MAKKLWSKKSIRPHEELAEEILKKLALQVDADAITHMVRQLNVRNVAQRIDMLLEGRYLRDATPPELFQKLRDYQVLIEFESGPLGLARLRRMAASYTHANIHLRARWEQEWKKRASNAPFKSPKLLIYAHGVRATVLEHFTPTAVECVFHANYFGLDVFLLDLGRVNKESSYNHLRLMCVPRAPTEEALIEQIQERLLSTRAHSSLTEPQVQELVMSYLNKTVESEFRRQDIYQTTMHEAYRKGEARGRQEGREEGGLSTLRQAIFELVELREITLDAASRERLKACDDIEQLQVWFRRIVRADTSTIEL